MLRYLAALLLCSIFIGDAIAQHVIKATVYESKTRVPLNNIRIQNLRTKQRIESDADGKFTIKASLNDLLVFNGFGYLTDTVLVTDTRINAYFIAPKTNMLKEVKVHEQEINIIGLRDTGLSKSPLYYHGQSMVYHVDQNGNYDGGVTFRLWYWKKDDRKRAKLQQKQNDENIRLKIDKVFNDDSLMKFLPLKKAEAAAFISLYVPSPKVYMANNFNLLLYLDTHYKQFMKLPPEKRVAAPLQAHLNPGARSPL